MGGFVKLVGFENPITRRDDVAKEVGDRLDIIVHQIVVGNICLEIGAGEYGDIPACTIEVSGDGVFVA